MFITFFFYYRVCRSWNALTKSPSLWKKVNVKFHYMHGSQNIVAKCFVDSLPACATCIRLDFRFRSSWTEPLNFKELSIKLQEKCPHLEVLFLYGAELSDNLPSVIHLCALFLPDVKKLTLNYVNFRDYPAREELSRISKIEVLDLSNCHLGHFNGPPFSRMPHLKDLSLVDTNANNSFFEDSTSFLNQLCVLNLRRSVFSSRLFNIIRNHGTNLKELYVCGTNLENNDLYFKKSVFPHLKTICLRYCDRVTYKGIKFLLQSCRSLKNVYVSSWKLASRSYTYGSWDTVKALNCSIHQK